MDSLACLLAVLDVQRRSRVQRRHNNDRLLLVAAVVASQRSRLVLAITAVRLTTKLHRPTLEALLQLLQAEFETTVHIRELLRLPGPRVGRGRGPRRAPRVFHPPANGYTHLRTAGNESRFKHRCRFTWRQFDELYDELEDEINLTRNQGMEPRAVQLAKRSRRCKRSGEQRLFDTLVTLRYRSARGHSRVCVAPTLLLVVHQASQPTEGHPGGVWARQELAPVGFLSCC